MMVRTDIKVGVRPAEARVWVIALDGEVTGAVEAELMSAYQQITNAGAKVIILDFNGLVYLNSSGIGMLVTLLIRANRQGQRLLAVRMNEYYQQVFKMTRLNEAIGLYGNEAEALADIAQAQGLVVAEGAGGRG
jgi:anti-sigma B factor antagonist